MLHVFTPPPGLEWSRPRAVRLSAAGRGMAIGAIAMALAGPAAGYAMFQESRRQTTERQQIIDHPALAAGIITKLTKDSKDSNSGTVHYAGGLGWRLGDPGSGYDIGRRGIARALLDLQAGMNSTKLAQALCQHMGLDDAAAITRKLYQDPEAVERIAPFAPVVLQLAKADHPAAKQVVVQSAVELLDIAEGIRRRARCASGRPGPLLPRLGDGMPQ